MALSMGTEQSQHSGLSGLFQIVASATLTKTRQLLRLKLSTQFASNAYRARKVVTESGEDNSTSMYVCNSWEDRNSLLNERDFSTFQVSPQ